MSKARLIVLLAGAAMTCSASAQTTDVARAYQDELLADSAARQSLLQNSKPDVKVGAQFQARFVVNQRDDAAPDEDTTLGFQNRRMKIWVDGNVTDDWSVRIMGAFSRSNGNFVLEDAFGRYKMDDNNELMFGQFKLPFLREESMSSTALLAADRTATNSVFTQGRSQAAQFSHTGEDFRVFVAFSDGLNTANTDFNSPAEADYGFTARGEWKWAGTWRQFRDFTSWQGSEMAGMVGGAVHWQSGGSTGGGGAPTADVDVLSATVDVSIEGDGWNGFGAFIYRNMDMAGGADFNDFGLILQGGIFLDAQWELFGRYDGTFADSDRGANVDDFHTITVGVNHYLIEKSHAAKITVDFQYFLDEQGSSIVPANTGTALLGSPNDSQWALRGQLQLLLP